MKSIQLGAFLVTVILISGQSLLAQEIPKAVAVDGGVVGQSPAELGAYCEAAEEEILDVFQYSFFAVGTQEEDAWWNRIFLLLSEIEKRKTALDALMAVTFSQPPSESRTRFIEAIVDAKEECNSAYARLRNLLKN